MLCVRFSFKIGVTGSVSVDANGDRKTDFVVEIYREDFIRVGNYQSFYGNLSMDAVGEM